MLVLNWLSSDRKVWGADNEYQKGRGREKDPLEKIKFDGACFSLGDGPMSLTVRTKFFLLFFFYFFLFFFIFFYFFLFFLFFNFFCLFI